MPRIAYAVETPGVQLNWSAARWFVQAIESAGVRAIVLEKEQEIIEWSWSARLYEIYFARNLISNENGMKFKVDYKFANLRNEEEESITRS